MPYRYYHIRIWLLCLLPFTVHVAAAQQQEKKTDTQQPFSYRLLHGETGWGYDIYSGHKKLIHQTAIPAIPGNKGFSNKTAARKVALLVISKLQQGEMPPSVTTPELRSLNIIP